jgi:hypothetical protein
MKQIGARQEAGRIGGIGPCGRQLCCACWMTNFNSVSTSAARVQDISLNPQKLAGQCGKLKCCMNFELDTYIEASKELPSKEIHLETLDSTYYHFKTDVFKGLISYSTSPHLGANIVTITAERAKEIIAMNKKGEKPGVIEAENLLKPEKPADGYENIVGQDSLTRFDNKNLKRRNGKNHQNNRRNDKQAAGEKQQGEAKKTQDGRNPNRRKNKKGYRNHNPNHQSENTNDETKH